MCSSDLESPVRELFHQPKHPYTRGLIQSVPDIRKKESTLHSIRGNVPIPGSVKASCQFAERCDFKFDRCTAEAPPIYEISETEKVRCFLFDEEGVGNYDATATKG